MTPGSRSPTRARPTTPPCGRDPSTTLRGRCCARDSASLLDHRAEQTQAGALAMTLEFLAPDAANGGERFAPLARTPMERAARAAGARFETRDGWSVAGGYAPGERGPRARPPAARRGGASPPPKPRAHPP